MLTPGQRGLRLKRSGFSSDVSCQPTKRLSGVNEVCVETLGGERRQMFNFRLGRGKGPKVLRNTEYVRGEEIWGGRSDNRNELEVSFV